MKLDEEVNYFHNPLTPRMFGEHFHVRRKELSLLEQAMKEGKSTLIIGPSRSGKTSLAAFYLDRAKKQGMQTSYFSIQDIRSADKFFREWNTGVKLDSIQEGPNLVICFDEFNGLDTTFIDRERVIEFIKQTRQKGTKIIAMSLVELTQVKGLDDLTKDIFQKFIRLSVIPLSDRPMN
jgi:predicted AAA+ superfamily ATPase